MTDAPPAEAAATEKQLPGPPEGELNEEGSSRARAIAAAAAGVATSAAGSVAGSVTTAAVGTAARPLPRGRLGAVACWKLSVVGSRRLRRRSRRGCCDEWRQQQQRRGIHDGSSGASAAPLPPDDGTVRGLGSTEVLRMANTLQGIFAGELAGHGSELQMPEVPRLVVVGTQSSGKSSLLNGIMAADILPLGEQMVTRAPLNLQLTHEPDASAMRAEFGQFRDGQWVVEESIALACPDPTSAQLTRIGRSNRRRRRAPALRRASPRSPSSSASFHLTCPTSRWLTSPADCSTTAQGQPKNKEQIRMVSSYIARSARSS